MRIILAAVLVLAALWSGYWFIGSRGAESEMRGWLDQRAAAGWVAGYSDVSTRGYPNRFDTTISDLDLGDKQSGVIWSAPFVQLFRLSYRPDHIIVVWPQTQSLRTPSQRLTLTNESAKGSFVFVSGGDMQLDHATFVAESVAVTSSDGWRVEASKALLATRPGPLTHAVDLGVDVTAIRIGGTLSDRLADTDLASGTIEQVKIDATLGFDAPWNKLAFAVNRPALTALDLRQMQIIWGDLEFNASGTLAIDAEGLPTGKIEIRAKNWREMLQLAVAMGWIPAGIAGPIESGLTFLASVSGAADTLEAPLKFENGKIAFGPITLGDAPRLILP